MRVVGHGSPVDGSLVDGSPVDGSPSVRGYIEFVFIVAILSVIIFFSTAGLRALLMRARVPAAHKVATVLSFSVFGVLLWAGMPFLLVLTRVPALRGSFMLGILFGIGLVQSLKWR